MHVLMGFAINMHIHINSVLMAKVLFINGAACISVLIGESSLHRTACAICVVAGTRTEINISFYDTKAVAVGKKLGRSKCACGAHAVRKRPGRNGMV